MVTWNWIWKTKQRRYVYCGQQAARHDLSIFCAAEPGPRRRPTVQGLRVLWFLLTQAAAQMTCPQLGLPAKTQVPPPRGYLHPFNRRVLFCVGFFVSQELCLLHLLTSGLSTSPPVYNRGRGSVLVSMIPEPLAWCLGSRNYFLDNVE